MGSLGDGWVGRPAAGGSPPALVTAGHPPAAELPCAPFHAAAAPPLTVAAGRAAPADFPRGGHGWSIGGRFTGVRRRRRASPPLLGGSQGPPGRAAGVGAVIQ